MKTAQEVRVGNVVMVGSDPMVVLRAEYNKSGRNSAVVKMKMKNLLTGSGQETVFYGSLVMLLSIPMFGWISFSVNKRRAAEHIAEAQRIAAAEAKA